MADASLTERARAVLAGMDEQDTIDACSAVALLDDRCESCPSIGIETAAEHGMIRLYGSRWRNTPLGREVDRLRSEERS